MSHREFSPTRRRPSRQRPWLALSPRGDIKRWENHLAHSVPSVQSTIFIRQSFASTVYSYRLGQNCQAKPGRGHVSSHLRSTFHRACASHPAPASAAQLRQRPRPKSAPRRVRPAPRYALASRREVTRVRPNVIPEAPSDVG